MSVKVRPFLRRGLERWEVDIRFNWPDGTVYRERKVAPGTSKSAAIKWGEARERELLAMGKEEAEKQSKKVDVEEPAAEVPTLAAFWDRYLMNHCVGSGQAASTIELNTIQFRGYLKPHLGHLRLDEISDAEVDAFKAKVTKRGKASDAEKDKLRPAPKTVNNALALLRHMLKTAKRWKLIEFVPCEIVKRKEPKKEAEFHTFEAFAALVEAAKKIDPRVHLFILLGGRAGLRRGEVVALRWKNVDFARGVIKVAEADFRGALKPPKNGKAREVPMTAELRAALEAHPKNGERVLLNDKGKPLTPQNVKTWLRRAERAAGLDGKGKSHRLRHTLLSHLALRGAPLRTIQEVAGHHALSMTARYLHLSPSAMTDAMQLVNDSTDTAPPTPAPVAPTPATPASATASSDPAQTLGDVLRGDGGKRRGDGARKKRRSEERGDEVTAPIAVLPRRLEFGDILETGEN